MQRLKDVEYEIDKKKGALDYLFNETENVTENLDTSVDYKFVEENYGHYIRILYHRKCQ